MIEAPAAVVVRPVRGRADVRRFVDLPYRLHRGSPQWAPTRLRRDAVRQLDRRRHPFYEHSDAAFFLAERSGEVVGRIAALENTRFNAYHHTRRGFFGHFECADDPDVSEALFTAALGWLRERGLEDVVGPRGVGGTDGTLLVEGFEHPAVVGVPWNPPYYERLVLAAGFEAAGDWASGWFPNDHVHDPRIYAVANRAKDQGGFRIQEFHSRRALRSWISRVLPVFLQAMAETTTFYPPTDRELDETVGALLMIANPRGVKLVMKGDEVAGFLLSYPNLAGQIRAVDGRLFPTGWWTILRGRSTERWFVINGLGLAPEHRGFGANAMLYAEITTTLLDEVGISRAEVVQVAASNARSLEDMKALGVRWYKTHRQYRLTL
jgi:hypothetical protein